MKAANDTTWGRDLTLLVGSDFNYFPGVYALFNSALLNGFAGRMKVLVGSAEEAKKLVRHERLEARVYQPFEGNYLENIKRMAALQDLENGDYLFLDADFIIERPLGMLLEPLAQGLILSSEPEQKYDPQDVLLFRMAKELGLKVPLTEMPYLNCGLVGFSYPRDRSLLSSWADLCRRHLPGVTEVCQTMDWLFPEQDILNVLVRQPGVVASTISPRRLELGGFAAPMPDRPFPHEKQGPFVPFDQSKFLIHGAALHRPWLKKKRPRSLKARILALLEQAGFPPGLKKLKPYHRAWAFYACGEGLPIPLGAWSDAHGFSLHRKGLWRKFNGLENS